MSLEVLKQGLLVTIQDGGRVGFQDKGMPKSGFMDVDAAQLANLLVNNLPNDSLIEIGGIGPTFKVLKKMTIAICGAQMNPKLNGKHLSMNKAILVYKNDVISFSSSSNGVYTYLAFAGTLKTIAFLNSISTYLPAKIGGINGSMLKKGDVIPIKSKTEKLNTKVVRKPFKTDVILECLKGPEYTLFSQKAINSFFSKEFTVDKDSNRIGIRLNGNLIDLPTNHQEIISSGIVKGTVQITKGGQPIIMMADAPTTGGYMRIANLTIKACNQLAQLPVGGKIKFQQISS